MTLHGPFREAWRKDRTKNKRKSSDLAWAVYLYAETSHKTTFSRYEQPERLLVLQEEFEVDLSSERAKEMISFYEDNCLDDMERQLKDYEDFLRRRTSFIISQEWNLETGAELDRAAGSTKKIWDDYLKIKKEFEAHMEKSQVEGNRQLSAIEDGALY